MTSKIINFLKFALSLSLIIIFIGLIFLWLKSPGTIQPITDEKGEIISQSISEHTILKIGETEQHLTIRGIDSTKQLILYLHGGPGNPINPGLRDSDLILEDEFVLVQWDQLGAGRSYTNKIKAEDIKIDSLIDYAKVVSQYLIKRFNKEKIHIIGQSWGAHLGMLLVNKYPDLFHSYLGIAQTIDVYEAEKMAFQWVKSQAELREDKVAIEELSQIKFPNSIIAFDEWNERFGWTHRSYVNKFGGIVYGEELHMVGSLIEPVLETPEYTIKQKVNYFQGLLFSLESTWEERLERALHTEVDSIQIPVIIVHGLHDYNIPHEQAKEYFNQLKAPYKRFYTFDKSAHSPIMEEVDKFNTVINNELLDRY